MTMRKRHIIAGALCLVMTVVGTGIITGCAPKGSGNQSQQETPTAQISQQKAEEIALKDAGVKREDVISVITEADTDDGKAVWEVEIHTGSIEHDYEIEADTGRIVSHESEKDTLSVNHPDTTQDTISLEQAVDIALEKSGLTKEQIANLVTEHDPEDAEWDVTFTADGMKYDYTISSQNGTVIEQSSEATEQPAEGSLTEDQAKETALGAAELTAKQVTNLAAEFDGQDNTWEVEFVFDGSEYDYEISAADGSILRMEKDLID